MSYAEQTSSQVHGNSKVSTSNKNDEGRSVVNDEPWRVSTEMIGIPPQFATHALHDLKPAETGVSKNNTARAISDVCAVYPVSNARALKQMAEIIGPSVVEDDYLNSKVVSSNRNPLKYESVARTTNNIDVLSIVERDTTTCSSGNLDDMLLDCRQTTFQARKHACKNGANKGNHTTSPMFGATEIISSRNSDLETTRISKWGRNNVKDNETNANWMNVEEKRYQVWDGDNNNINIKTDPVLFDPTDAGISSLDQNLNTTWVSFFDDDEKQKLVPDANHDELTQRDELQGADWNTTLTSTLYDLTMSNNVQHLEDGTYSIDTNPNGALTNQENPVNNSDSANSREDTTNTPDVVTTSETGQNKDGLENMTALSTATSEDSQSTINNPEVELQSDESPDLEDIIGDVEAAQFDFGSVIPRCHITVISPKERTEEDAQALLKQIINGEPDPCLAPELVGTYVRSKLEVVENDDIKEQQNISLHNATDTNLNDERSIHHGTTLNNRRELSHVAGLLFQHLKKDEVNVGFVDQMQGQDFVEEKDENGRFPYCGTAEVSVVDSVILTSRDSRTYCVDNTSNYSDGMDREPIITCSYTRVNEESDEFGQDKNCYRDDDGVNEKNETCLAHYEQSHVIYKPVRTGSFVVSRSGRGDEDNTTGIDYDGIGLNKNCGDLESPTQLHQQFNGDCLQYVTPECKRSLDSLTKSPQPSPMNVLVGTVCPSNSEVDSVDGYKASNRQLSHANRMNGIRSLFGPTSCLYTGQDTGVKIDKDGTDRPPKQCNTISLSHKPESEHGANNGGSTLLRNYNDSSVKKNRLLPDINKFQSIRNDCIPKTSLSPQRVRKVGLTVTKGSTVRPVTAFQSNDKGEPCLKRNSSSRSSLIRKTLHEKSASAPKDNTKSVSLGSGGINKKKVPPISRNIDNVELETTNTENDSNERAVPSTTGNAKENNIISISTGSACSSSCTLSSSVPERGTQNRKTSRPTKTKKSDPYNKRPLNCNQRWTGFDKGSGPYFGSFMPSCLLYTPKKHLNPKTTSAEEYHRYKMDLRLSQSLARIKRGPPTVDCYLDPRFKPKQERARSQSQKRHQSHPLVPQTSQAVGGTGMVDTTSSAINRNKNATKSLVVA